MTVLWITLAVAAYLAVTIPTNRAWRRRASRNWAWVEEGKAARAELIAARNAAWRSTDDLALKARLRAERDAAEEHMGAVRERAPIGVVSYWLTLHSDSFAPSRPYVIWMAWWVTVTTPLRFTGRQVSRAGGFWAKSMTAPPKDEQRRRDLTTARADVERLERELGIGDHA